MRRENDAYYTPDDVAGKCVATIAGHLRGSWIVEPSVGGGSFLRAMAHRQPFGVSVCDIDPDAAGFEIGGVPFVGDFLTMPRPNTPRPIWVVGNPPYKHAMEHVEHALSMAMPNPGGVAFLLRLAFVESESRRAFWRKWPVTEMHILSKRPSFTGGKTDSCAYAFFVWHAGERQPVGWI